MTRDEQEDLGAEHCLWNLERLVALGDEQMASLSLDFYGAEFEDILSPGQRDRLHAIEEQLAQLRGDTVDVSEPGSYGLH